MFSGKEIIDVKIYKPTKEITLHAVGLKISNVVLRSGHNDTRVFKQSINAQQETVTFTFKSQIPAGNAKLYLSFFGTLSDQLKGFYKSSYTHNGQQKHLAVTQFESTDARRAFPCFDEPAQKAIFDVTLIIPSQLTAISNTVETSVVEHTPGFKTVTFAPSPKMSTYLLAFIVGEFEYVETKSRHGVIVRVFTTPGKKHQAKFALQTAARALDFYEDYFAIKYPLPVLDLIALPDFASAAMENWGAVTYRETALLVDEANTSAANKQWVAIVVAHELAHQWFGNLVTMEWWTDLWLNEGFASYMEYVCVDKLFPEWRMWEQYISGRLAVALRLDALQTSHPIEIEVHHPDEISEIFDQVSYAKGSSIIRMLAEFLGEKDFRQGLRNYLKKHAYGNAVTNDLWKALESASKKPVRKIMGMWTKKTGYPLITIAEKGKQLQLSQSRYFSSEVSRKAFKDKTIWSVPLTLIETSKKSKKLLLTKKQQDITKPKSSWIKLNANETSLTRVAYPVSMLRSLQKAITAKKMNSSDRLGIIRDAFALSESGEFATSHALALAKSFNLETSLPVWEELSSGLYLVEGLLIGTKEYEAYRLFAKNLFTNLVASVGWEGSKHEDHLTKMLRSLALSAYGHFGDKKTIVQAQQLFKKHLRGKHISPDIRGVVYSLVAKNGGEKELRAFLSLYKKTDVHEEQDRIGRTLGNFSGKKMLQKVIDFSLSKHVRTQDSPSIFVRVAINPFGRELAWKYLKKHWTKTLYPRFKAGGHLLEWFVTPFARFSSLEKAREVEQFFRKNSSAGIDRAVSQVIERIRSTASWKSRDQQHIQKWLQR